MAAIDVDKVLRGYIVCALWASTDEEGTPLDTTYDADDVAEPTVDKWREDCTTFLEMVESELGNDVWHRSIWQAEPERIGHDLFLSRNHHGAGFWDRGQGQRGDDLTLLAQSMGDDSLYVGDDEIVYTRNAD